MTIDEQDRTAEEARDWIVRRASGAFSEEDQAALHRWLSRSERHKRAFEEEQAFWHSLDALVPVFEQCDAPSRSPRAIARRWHLAGLALAACALFLFLLPAIEIALFATAVSGAEGTVTLRLEDGSRLVLNRNSAVRADFDETARVVELIRGELFVKVKDDPDRPFRVLAEGGRTDALGTAFAVRNRDGQVRVAVREGRVAVTPSVAQAPSVDLVAGEGLRYEDGSVVGAGLGMELMRELAWLDGKVVFEDRPLREALDELEAYHPGRILLLGSLEDQRPISGTVDLDHLDDGIAALAAVHDLTVHEITPFLTLLR